MVRGTVTATRATKVTDRRGPIIAKRVAQAWGHCPEQRKIAGELIMMKVAKVVIESAYISFFAGHVILHHNVEGFKGRN